MSTGQSPTPVYCVAHTRANDISDRHNTTPPSPTTRNTRADDAAPMTPRMAVETSWIYIIPASYNVRRHVFFQLLSLKLRGGKNGLRISNEILDALERRARSSYAKQVSYADVGPRVLRLVLANVLDCHTWHDWLRAIAPGSLRKEACRREPSRAVCRMLLFFSVEKEGA